MYVYSGSLPVMPIASFAGILGLICFGIAAAPSGAYPRKAGYLLVAGDLHRRLGLVTFHGPTVAQLGDLTAAARQMPDAVAVVEPLGRGDPRQAWRSALQDAARNAATALALSYAEESKPIQEVVADLSSRDPAVRDHAVRVVGDRRSSAAVPALIERLKDPDPKIVHRWVAIPFTTAPAPITPIKSKNCDSRFGVACAT